MTTMLAIGLGYVARRLIGRPEARGWRLRATTRSAAAAGPGRTMDVAPVGFDGLQPSPALAAAIGEATHVVVSVPPDAAGDPVLRHHRADLLRAPRLEWIGYLSTVGVYGDTGGAWVDETAPVNPSSLRSRWRAAAEAEWLALGEAGRMRVEVFRLAGIYGPGRSPFDAIRAGTARRIIKPGQVFNRIHVDDIARVLLAAMAHATPYRVFNVSDAEPAPPEEVIAHAAALIGAPTPPAVPIEAADLSPMAQSFYAECKRVSSRRLSAALGIALDHPSYREGLAAILAEERGGSGGAIGIAGRADGSAPPYNRS